MSHTTLNGKSVLEGTVTMPRRGLWVADVVIDAEVAPAGSVTLRVGQALTLKGVVLSANVFAGKVRARIAAGAGRLGTALPPSFYRGAPARLPVVDVLEGAGERLSTTSDDELLETVLEPSWSRSEAPAAHTLHQLADLLGATWRVLPDGSTFFGRDDFVAAPTMPDAVVLEDHGGEGLVILATEAPTVLPGMGYGGRGVSSVELTLGPDQIRTTLWLERSSGTQRDRTAEALHRIIQSEVRPAVDPLALYAGTVVRTDEAGRLDVKLDQTRIAPVSGAALRLGVPGITVKVKDGSRVLVSFENGDMRRPIATLWDSDSVESMTITATGKVMVNAESVELRPNGRAIACQGDLVKISTPVVGVPLFACLGVPPGLPGTGLPVPAGTPVPIYFCNALGVPVGAFGQIVGTTSPNKS